MFDKQYRFTGSHAEKVSALTSVFDDVAKAKLFERNLDVYMNAPLIGFLFKRKGVKNSDGDIADQNIFPEQLINNSEQLKYIFRLILILDTQHEPNEEARLDKAFRRFGADEADLQLFDAYVLAALRFCTKNSLKDQPIQLNILIACMTSSRNSTSDLIMALPAKISWTCVGLMLNKR